MNNLYNVIIEFYFSFIKVFSISIEGFFINVSQSQLVIHKKAL